MLLLKHNECSSVSCDVTLDCFLVFWTELPTEANQRTFKKVWGALSNGSEKLHWFETTVHKPFPHALPYAHRKSKIGPHAPTTHAQFTNPFRTHFRTHIARAEVRFYAHVRRNPTSECTWAWSLGWSKNPVSSQTDILMAGTKFSDYLGLNHYKKAKKN